MLCSLFFDIFVLCLSFIFSFILHPSCIIPLLISSFLSLLPLDCFVYSWQKGGEYTGLYRHFYITHVHTLRGSNFTLCTFVGGESHRGDAYTKGEKTFFIWGNLVLLYACFLVALWCFELCLVSSMLCCSYHIMLLCPSRILFLDAYTSCILHWSSVWTWIYPYAIVFYWLHVRMIICFAIWSLWSFPYDYHMFDQVAHMFHNMFTWSHFTCYIILVLLSLDLPWGSNVFCASVSGYRYICSKCYITSRFSVSEFCHCSQTHV